MRRQMQRKSIRQIDELGIGQGLTLAPAAPGRDLDCGRGREARCRFGQKRMQQNSARMRVGRHIAPLSPR
jgi:hypothetical protein